MMALYVILASFELHLLAPDETVDDVLIYTPTTQTVGTVGGRRTRGWFGTQMKNSSGWTRSLRSHDRSKCNLRAICGGTSGQFSPIENADWTEYVILNWLVPGHPPEQKRGVIRMLAPSEHGMFFSEGREMEHQHQGSMWPSKYGFYQVGGRRREN